MAHTTHVHAAHALISLGIGVLGGVIALWILRVGIFMTGACLGLGISLFRGLSCNLHVLRGVPFAGRSDRFNGVTFGLLGIQLPAGMNLLSPLEAGFEFADSQCRLPNGFLLKQRYMKIWDMPLEFAEPLPSAREDWPHPLTRVLACLPIGLSNAVVGVWATVVDAKCASLDAGLENDTATKRHKRAWRKLQALVPAMCADPASARL